MTKNKLENEYFEWVCELINADPYHPKCHYRKLLTCLHKTEFIFTLEMDGNRSADGIDLRYRFGYEHDHERSMIDTYLSARACSVLEMMVALAMRCEEHIMDDPDEGDRTGQWFWGMIKNLGLDGMNDLLFNKRHVDNSLSIFLNRGFKRNGEGGLFTVNNCKEDLRNCEIWYQMCWYLDRIL